MPAERVLSPSPPATFVDILFERARSEYADRGYTFLVDGEVREETLSYTALDARARALGAHLLALGASGERALLVFEPGFDFIAALFGCLYARVVAVPLYPPDRLRPAFGSEHMERVARDCSARFALTTRDLLGRLQPAAGGRPAAAALAWIDVAAVRLAQAETWRRPAVEPVHPAILQYTSGSTGEPKGVVVSHANLIANARFIAAAFSISEASIGVSWLPPHHDMGLMGGILQPLYLGARSVLLSPDSFLQRPARWLQAISRYHATTCGGPNFAYDLLARRVTAAAKAELDLSSWSVAFCGAEPVRAETLEAFAAAFATCGFRRQAFLPCYGLAEATLLVTAAQPSRGAQVLRLDAKAIEDGLALPAPSGEATRSLVSCGRPPEGVTVRIVDAESGRACAGGCVGEVWVKGEGVASGYWGDPETSGATFAARLPDGDGPYLRTGDLGSLVDGELILTGRLKDLIVLRGRNLYPQDLEATLEGAHPHVRRGRSAAFSAELDGAERLVVACEVSRRAEQDLSQIAETLRRAVASGHGVLPDAVVLVEPGGLPRTSSGKPRRPLCRTLFREGRLGRTIPPASGGAWNA